MSLIHDALKKVDIGGGGIGASRERHVSVGGKRGGALPKAAAGAVIAALIAAAAVLVQIHYASNPAPEGAQAVAVREAPADNEGPSGPAVSQTVAQPDHNAHGVLLFREGRYQEAADKFRRAAAVPAAGPSVHNNLGLALSRLGDADEAEAAFKTALSADPAHAESLNSYGTLLVSRGSHSQALSLFERAVAAEPSYADARFNLAVALEREGRIVEAIRSYEGFLEASRSSALNDEVRRKLVRLRAVAAFER